MESNFIMCFFFCCWFLLLFVCSHFKELCFVQYTRKSENKKKIQKLIKLVNCVKITMNVKLVIYLKIFYKFKHLSFKKNERRQEIFNKTVQKVNYNCIIVTILCTCSIYKMFNSCFFSCLIYLFLKMKRGIKKLKIICKKCNSNFPHCLLFLQLAGLYWKICEFSIC